MSDRHRLHELVNTTMHSSWSDDMTERQIVAFVIDAYGPTQNEKKRVRSLVYKRVRKWRRDRLRYTAREGSEGGDETKDPFAASFIAQNFPEFLYWDVGLLPSSSTDPSPS